MPKQQNAFKIVMKIVKVGLNTENVTKIQDICYQIVKKVAIRIVMKIVNGGLKTENVAKIQVICYQIVKKVAHK